jgi:hypothetical protein
LDKVSVLLLWILVIIQLGITFMLTKLISAFLNSSGVKNLPKLEIGSKAPLFREFDQNGNIITLENNKVTLLLFIKDTCNNCKNILNNINKIKNINIEIILISGLADNWDLTQLPKDIPLIQSSIVMRNYLIERVPTAVLIDEFGFIKVNKFIEGIEDLKSEILLYTNQPA